jgi:hypothetical protein
MFVGIGQILLRLPGNHSLKGKRRVIRQIMGRVKNKFNISVAEVGAQDQWQLIQFGLCEVGLNGNRVRAEIDKVVNFIDDMNLTEIIDTEVEIISFSTRKALHEKLSPCL